MRWCSAHSPAVRCLAVLVLLFACHYWYSTSDGAEPAEPAEHLNGRLVIFTATPFFDVPIKNSILDECLPEIKNTCFVTSRRSLLPNASAVVFHSRDFYEYKMYQFAAHRNSAIPFVLMSLESPFHADLHEYRNFFNWTMSYRTDSEVFHPYGSLVKRTTKKKVDFEKLWNSKKKEALWLVSNSQSTTNQRKELVEKLVEHGLEVDLLGKLYGREPPECSRARSTKSCELELHTPYKFYVAFENSNCKDYVTEKFWRKARNFGMVPIVMSRRIYRDLGIPDSMYISVDDFSSLDDFVSHVKRVSSNKTAYLEYHTWREDFRILDANEQVIGFCDLCRKVAAFTGGPKKTYDNVMTWNSEAECDNSFAQRYL